MSGASTYDPQEADMLDQLTADLSMPETSLVWEVYVERGFDSAAQAAKSFKSAFKTRYKVTDTPPQGVLDALNALYGQLGDWDAVLARLSAPVVEQKRSDPARQHTPSIAALSAQKAYDVNQDLQARIMGADQLGRKR